MSPPHDKPATTPPGVAPPRREARFRDTALASGLVTAAEIAECESGAAQTLDPAARNDTSRWDAALADCLVKQQTLTKFQAKELLAGKQKFSLGQYQILDEIGRGGMGQVFRARHVLMGRTVAIKVLPLKKSTQETEAAFQREIRILARLDHVHLVRALDAGHDGNVYYLVTELVPGLDLRRQVLKHGRLDEETAASVISQAAVGLAYAHGQGLFHRDVKPANLLVTPDGHVKVLDLGLAGSTIEGEIQQLEGRIVGTMDYMAPEQIRSPKDVGPTADVYGLGCTLYFMLTGEPPFPGGTRQEKSQRQLSEQPRPIRQIAPNVSQAFSLVVEAMMEKDPQKRLPSAEAVVERLRPWTPASPVPMPRSIPAQSASTPAPQARPARVAGGAVPTLCELSTDSGSSGAAQAGTQPMRGLSSALDDTHRDVSISGGEQTAPSHSDASPEASLVTGSRTQAGLWIFGRSVVAAVITFLIGVLFFKGANLGLLACTTAVFVLALAWQLVAAFRGAGGRR